MRKQKNKIYKLNKEKKVTKLTDYKDGRQVEVNEGKNW